MKSDNKSLPLRMLNLNGTEMNDQKGRPIFRSQFLFTHPVRKDIKDRVGCVGRKFYYLSGEGAIRTMNLIFGYDGWGTEILDMKEIQCEKDRDSNQWVVGYSATVRVKVREGFSHDDVGFGDGNMKSKIGACEKAMKSAVTDALKRAARHYGERLGNALYVKGNPFPNAPVDNRQAIEKLQTWQQDYLFGDQEEHVADESDHPRTPLDPGSHSNDNPPFHPNNDGTFPLQAPARVTPPKRTTEPSNSNAQSNSSSHNSSNSPSPSFAPQILPPSITRPMNKSNTPPLPYNYAPLMPAQHQHFSTNNANQLPITHFPENNNNTNAKQPPPSSIHSEVASPIAAPVPQHPHLYPNQNPCLSPSPKPNNNPHTLNDDDNNNINTPSNNPNNNQLFLPPSPYMFGHIQHTSHSAPPQPVYPAGCYQGKTDDVAPSHPRKRPATNPYVQDHG